MVDLWFVLVCAMFAAYVVLDGYDLGAGIAMPFVAKDDAERRALLETILPVWDGNEVFLVAGGATLYLAFPRLFPAFVSGFYLPVMIVLWLLMLRGLGIEMRHKLDQALWNQLWDGGFFLSSALLVFFFGAALGNVVRGVTVDESGDFFAPLWTNFTVGDKVGILDWYTVLIGATAVAIIARHGALRLAARTEAPAVADRAAGLARRLRSPVLLLAVSATAATFVVQPHVRESLRERPWTGLIGMVALAGGVISALPGAERAFRGSAASLAGLFGCACVGVYPYGLLARDPARSVLAESAAAGRYALGVGLAWWIPGMLIVAGYTLVVRRILLKQGRVGATVPGDKPGH
jgi:cytochrome d ubiquinol oxidase subunit II